jgi:hypothetical protein
VKGIEASLPVVIGWDYVVDLELLSDLRDAHMDEIRVNLLRGHVGFDIDGKTHQASSLVVFLGTPSGLSLALRWRAIVVNCQWLV